VFESLEEEARAVLPADAYEYYAAGAGEGQTLAENREAWRRVWLRPRGLVDVAAVDTGVALLGHRLAAPVLVAPMARLGLLHPEGEVAAARAAAGSVLCVSTRSSRSLEEIAAAAAGPLWLQLYVERDRARTEELLARARALGFARVLLTIDLAVPGRRAAGLDLVGGWDATLTWEDLAWVREASGLPVGVKGVLTEEDAAEAARHGADALVVSNHGGRQLDGCVPTAVALREVAAATDLPVLVDGGVRSGTDVARALALGAAAVLVGRPVAWGLAVGGQDGVREVLGALRDDLARTLALLGAPTPADVSRQSARLAGW